MLERLVLSLLDAPADWRISVEAPVGFGVGISSGLCPREERHRGRRTRLGVRLLGELELRRDGQVVALPASKKTRALLGYLVATGQSQRRERLCDLLWEGPDDPRAELRWSLSKLRPLVNDRAIRLKADRERIAFEPCDAEVDVNEVCRLVGIDGAAASLSELEAASTLLRGEFLDGLDLPACYRFQEWCLAQRERVSALRLTVLRKLVEAQDASPANALVHAKTLVAADPLSEAAHAAVVRLLGRTRRFREASAHAERARHLLEQELGAPLSGALDQARRAIRPAAGGGIPPQAVQTADNVSAPESRRHAPVPLIGRDPQRQKLDGYVTGVANGTAHQVLLVTGEPGIGKTRLLGYLQERIALVGGQTLRGRAFEAEAMRPYGVWIDALRQIPSGDIPDDLRAGLEVLRPDPGTSDSGQAGRTQLFSRVVALLMHLTREKPLLLVLDDLQWLDEASAVLLHYTVRAFDTPSALLIACAARPGELDDNQPVTRTIRSLAHDDRLVELPLGALSADETSELLRAVEPRRDVQDLVAQSGGNPLFALELAWARRQGGSNPGETLAAVINGQLSRLQDRSRDLVVWAAALSRSFSATLLAKVSGLDTPKLLGALDELERRGVIQGSTDDLYDFVHDLVRAGAYRTLSQPRRKLAHRHIAHHLAPVARDDDSFAGELARHADLGGDFVAAAEACVLAGERCLRLFASVEARFYADQGLRHIERVDEKSRRLELAIALLKIKVMAESGPSMRPLSGIAETLSRVVADAEAAGLAEATATGHYLLSVVHLDAGEIELAQESTMRAAEAGRAANGSSRARQIANTARCLIELETDIPRARALIAEVQTLMTAHTPHDCELDWGRGLLRRWDGRIDEAAALIERALVTARAAGDRWSMTNLILHTLSMRRRPCT